MKLLKRFLAPLGAMLALSACVDGSDFASAYADYSYTQPTNTCTTYGGGLYSCPGGGWGNTNEGTYSSPYYRMNSHGEAYVSDGSGNWERARHMD